MRGKRQPKLESSETSHVEIPKEGRKMKYFRKIEPCKQYSAFKLLIKRNYCLVPLNPFNYSLDPPAGERKRMLERQKFVAREYLWDNCFFPKGGNNFRYLTELNCSVSKEFQKERFWKSISLLPNLQKLVFSFGRLWRTEPDEIALFLKSFAKYLNRLTRLTLNFYRNLGDQTMEGLAQQIRTNWKNLQELNLKFSWYDSLTNKQVEVLIKAIDQDLKSLQFLSLSFQSGQKMTQTGLETLATKLGTSLCSLQTLKISFSLNKLITGDGMEALIMRIGQNIPTLQRFCFELSDCPNISNINIESTVKQLANHFKRLTHLRINFSGCPKTTDMVVEHVADHIMRQFENLKFFSFALALNNCLTDKGIEALTKQISNLKGLTKLRFDFYGCSKIHKAGIKLLVTEIQSHLKLLQDFYLLDASGEVQTLATILKK